MSIVVAGVLCIGLAIGHTILGHAWVLPRLRRDALPQTPFGSGAMTKNFLAVTWDIVAIAAVGMGVLIIAVADHDASSERTWILNTVAAIFTAATLVVVWRSRRRPAALVRAPMWALFAVIAVLRWFTR